LRTSEPSGKALFPVESVTAGVFVVICRATDGVWRTPLYIMAAVAQGNFLTNNSMSYYDGGCVQGLRFTTFRLLQVELAKLL
jgi:hypothetical protein